MTKPKKMALLFSGLHYFEDYKRESGPQKEWRNGTIDFRRYTKNITVKILDYFKQKNFDIDIYISTNKSNILPYFIYQYNPIQSIVEDSTNRLKKTKALLTTLDEKKYDMIFLTRPDIYIIDNFDNLDYDKFNIVSQTEKHNGYDDNIHIFPAKFFNTFKTIIGSLDDKDIFAMHYINFQEIFGDNLHFLKNERRFVPDLSFFGLRFFQNNKDFVINAYIFSDDHPYYYKNSEIVKTSNKIVLKSKPDNSGAYLSYILGEAGEYQLTFQITNNNTHATNQLFIKLIKMAKKYLTPAIKPGDKAEVGLTILTQANNEELRLDFTETEHPINIEITNLNVINTVKKLPDYVSSVYNKCVKGKCIYKKHKNIKNNGDTHCCNVCKNSINDHGPACEGLVFK